MTDFLKSSEFVWTFNILSIVYVLIRCIIIYQSSLSKYKETKSQQVLNGVPGLCVSLGVLFTFISIAITLLVLVNSDSQEDFSIYNLAGSLLPAFLTSIEGNVMSIYYTKRIHRIFADEEAEDTKINGDTTSNLHEMKVAIQSIQSALVGLNDESAKFEEILINKMLSFLGASQAGFEKNLSVLLTEEMDKLTKATTLLCENMNTTFGATVKKNEKMYEDLVSAAKTNYTNMSKTVECNLNTINVSTAQTLEQMSKTMQQTLQETQQMLKQTHELVQNQMGQTSERIDRFAQEQMQEMKTSLQGLRNCAESGYVEMVGEMGTKMDNLAHILGQDARDIVTSIGDAAESARVDVEAINTGIKTSVESMVGQLGAAIQMPLEQFKGEVKFMEEQIGSICKKYDEAVVAYRDALKAVHTQSDLWEKSAEQTAKSLTMVEETNQSLDKLLDVIKIRHENTTSLETQLQHMGEAVSELRQLNVVLSDLAHPIQTMSEKE